MYRRLAALLLAVTLLAGCAVRPVVDIRSFMPEPDGFGDSPTPTPQTQYTASQRLYGSAGLLAWPTVLVSVYLDEINGAHWTEEAIAQSRRNLKIAVDWITEQGRGYGVEPKIYYDDGMADNMLFYHTGVAQKFLGSAESTESEEVETIIDQMIAELDTDALHAQYGTSSVGFLFFLPLAGCSYTMVHYSDEGDEAYYEYSILYRDDVFSEPETFEIPAVYAHEILHMFGAPDLYQGSVDVYVTEELSAWVEQKWPDAIMIDTGGRDGADSYERIDRSICPLTAYRLGWITTFDGMEQWPDISVIPPGAFAGELVGSTVLPGAV